MISTILVTAVGGDLGRDIVRCMKFRSPKVRIIGIDMDPFSAGRPLVDSFEIAPAVKNEKAYLSFVKNLIAKYRIDVICPCSEIEIRFFNRSRSEFPTVKMLMQDPHVLDVSLDKFKTVEWLKAHSMLYPKTFHGKDYKNELSWPVIVKERTGSGSRGLGLANNKTDLDFFLGRLENPLVQEHVGESSQEYTVGVFSDGTEVRQIQFRRQLGLSGLSQKAELINDPVLTDLIERMAKELKLKGSINLQLRKTDKGYVAFEINPRFSSTVYLRHCLGFKDVLWSLELLEGKPSAYVPPKEALVAVRMVEEIFFKTNGEPMSNPGEKNGVQL